jgi:hypothetical protein
MPKPTRSRRSSRCLIILAVCAAFALAVAGCCYAVGIVVTAFLSGLGELAAAVVAIATVLLAISIIMSLYMLLAATNWVVALVVVAWLIYVGDLMTIFTQLLQMMRLR